MIQNMQFKKRKVYFALIEVKLILKLVHKKNINNSLILIIAPIRHRNLFYLHNDLKLL